MTPEISFKVVIFRQTVNEYYSIHISLEILLNAHFSWGIFRKYSKHSFFLFSALIC